MRTDNTQKIVALKEGARSGVREEVGAAAYVIVDEALCVVLVAEVF